MAQREIWGNFHASNSADTDYPVPAPWLKLEPPNALPRDYAGLLDTQGQATSVVLRAESPWPISGGISTIPSPEAIDEGFPRAVRASYWRSQAQATYTWSHLVPGTTVELTVVQGYLAVGSTRLTVGDTVVELPSSGTAVMRAPQQFITQVSTDGTVSLLVENLEVALFTTHIAAFKLLFRDGIGDLDYPTVVPRLVVDEFGTLFDGAETIHAEFYDPITKALIDESDAFIGADGLIAAGTPNLEYATDYRVVFTTPTRNWAGILRTGV